MKKIILFSSALVALTILASCQKEQLIETPTTETPITATGITEFTATIEQPTKSAIAADGKVTWIAGDEITVTDLMKNSAVYVAASSEATTTFTLKEGQTAVVLGPYTATYGDISKQVYGAAGANCPLSAPSTSGTTFHFSSPYAVVKITAKSSNSEIIKSVNVTYGANSYDLDCGGGGVTLTDTGEDFYVAVRPASEAAALSVTFCTDNKIAKRTRTSAVALAAKDILPVTFNSFDWNKRLTLKAVYDTNDGANTLTFYYDDLDYSGDGLTVYENGTTNYLFDITKSKQYSWGYNGIANAVKSVVIDASVAGYSGLTSTAYMFYNLQKATSITGAQYLDVSNVTDMNRMFYNFGYNSTDLNVVPDVSKWDTGNVTDMSRMFDSYCKNSTALNVVPDVSKWDTGNVTDMEDLFFYYGYNSTELNKVPDVSKWDTGNVTSIDQIFDSYGSKSTVLNAVPDVSKWDTGNVTTMKEIFYQYGSTSTILNAVPDVSKWNTGNVTNMKRAFGNYGYKSDALNAVPDVSQWNTGNVTSINQIFYSYGKKNQVKFVLDLSGWNLMKITDMTSAFAVSTPNEFKVTIPAKTGDLDNEESLWYGSTSGISVAPPKGQKFTLAGAYTVLFNLNGQSGTVPASRSVSPGKKVMKPSPDPTTEGYVFAGWYKETGCTNAWDFDTDTVSGDMTLYAKWIEAKPVSEILATFTGGFPTAESDAWTSPEGNKCFIYQTFLAFSSGSIAAGLGLTENALKMSANSYLLITPDDEEIVFYMTGGKLTSIFFDGKTGKYAEVTGLYTPAE